MHGIPKVEQITLDALWRNVSKKYDATRTDPNHVELIAHHLGADVAVATRAIQISRWRTLTAAS